MLYLCLRLYFNQQYYHMFNPNQFVRAANSSSTQSTRLVLQKISDHTKSRWDEPITVPDILYMKFRLPIPNSSTPKQTKIYPLSLIEYIKRSFDRCKDENQSRMMESELKILLSKFQSNYHAVNWDNMAPPSIGQQKKNLAVTMPVIKQTIIKKQTVNLHKQHGQNPYQINKQEEAPSKMKMKINKTLQKLQQKLSRKEQAPQQKTFIGFSNQPVDNYQQPVIRSQINPNLRVILNPPIVPISNKTQRSSNFCPPPPPPPPPSKNQQQKSTHKSSVLQNKFSKAADKFSQKSITVITSTTPEPIEFNKNKNSTQSDQRFKNQSEADKSKGKVVMTRKELNQISKVAQKVSNLHQVAKRYESFNRLKTETIKNIQQDDVINENDDEIIIGKNTNIDKPYLRITGRPDPDLVRPEPVLRKALIHFMKEYKQGNVAYDLFISQMKSIRQDLTVQHIRNSFTVQVYEENLKISLFENDIIQVKQCQANLWQFYREGLYHSKETRGKFISYNFITLILEQKYKQLEYMLTLLPEGSLEIPEIQESLRLKQILMLGNYRAFFESYNQKDQISRQLLNIYIDKIRMRCLVMFSKTCGQKISFKLLGETIGQDQDVIEALATGEGAVVRQGFFMLKQSYQILAKSDFLVTKKVTNLLI